MFKVTQDEIEFQKLVNKQKKDLDKTFKKSFAEQEEVMRVFVKSINHCNFNKFSDDKIIWNAAGFVNIISLDLKHLARDLAFADDEWGKRIYARLISMLIYESINDLFDMLGRDFRKVINKLSKANEFQVELNDLIRNFNNYKNENIHRLKEIRNVATAHRDNNLLEQYNLITSIGWTEFVTIGSRYDKLLNDLGSFLMKVINTSVGELEK